jgi:DNA-binding NarL/FixJ family response regulator
MNKTPIRVLLADDHQMLRDGLRALLNSQPDMQVVAEAGTGNDAIRLAGEARPDVIVMDLGMPGVSGLDAIQAIRRQNLSTRIVVLSMHGGREIITQALQAGADGYVPKSSAHESLLQAIRVVHTGQRLALSPKTVDTYRQRAMEKLDLNNRSDLIRFALRAGLLDDKASH